jgi:hypothetical protein
MVNLATQATQAPRFRQSFFSNQPAHFRRWALAVLLLAALLFLLRLGDRGLWGSESRWGEITRELQLTGWLIAAIGSGPMGGGLWGCGSSWPLHR